mgnify:CR=1 FL=1
MDLLVRAAAPLSSPSQARSPLNGMLSGMGAAELLHCLAGSTAQQEQVEGVSRKDKSLGLLCDNFLQLFASGTASSVELESVASTLGVGRRRIYDIVNVLESLDIVQKEKASSYIWLGISKLPTCVARLRTGRSPVDLLVDDVPQGDTAINLSTSRAMTSFSGGSEEGVRRPSSDERNAVSESRKEKSIRELSTKFVCLFLQAASTPSLEGIISLEQVHLPLALSLMDEKIILFLTREFVGRALASPAREQQGRARPWSNEDKGAPQPTETRKALLATTISQQVRRLYDICNVLTSLRMIEKVLHLEPRRHTAYSQV